MKIRIDDVYYSIECYIDDDWEEIIKLKDYRSFDLIVKDVLTGNQFDKYIGTDTARVFNISKSKQSILNKYI